MIKGVLDYEADKELVSLVKILHYSQLGKMEEKTKLKKLRRVYGSLEKTMIYPLKMALKPHCYLKIIDNKLSIKEIAKKLGYNSHTILSLRQSLIKAGIIKRREKSSIIERQGLKILIEEHGIENIDEKKIRDLSMIDFRLRGIKFNPRGLSKIKKKLIESLNSGKLEELITS